jgi:hypothetical protein
MSGKVTVSSNRAVYRGRRSWLVLVITDAVVIRRVPHFSRPLREVGGFARLHHRIVSPVRKWMAAQKSHECHESSPYHPITFHRFHRILRAGRNVAARRREHRRDGPLVSSQHLQANEFGKLAHGNRLQAPGFRRADVFCSVPIAVGVPPASFSSITTNARPTSFTTSPKSTVKSPFFGLMTTSALAPTGGRVSRTASRNRRFIRLRSTAPPSARPTVNPMRSPETPGGFAELKPALGRGQ